MVRTRSTRDSDASPSLAGPSGRATRPRARQAEAEAEGIRPESQPGSSNEALATRYGAPARRAANRPSEEITLSQITTAQSDDGESPSQPLSADDSTIIKYVTTLGIEDSQEDSVQSSKPQESSPGAALLPENADPGQIHAIHVDEQLQETIDLRTAGLDDLRESAEGLFEQLFDKQSNKGYWVKLVALKRQNYSGFRELYSRPDQPFIDLGEIRETVEPNIAFQARTIAVLANLVRFLDKWTTSKEVDYLKDDCTLLDKAEFPAPFTPWIGEENLTDEDVDQAISIRIQSFIVTVEKSNGKAQPNKQKITAWVAQYFCEHGHNVVAENMTGICGLEYPLPQHIAEKCCEQAMAIIEQAKGRTMLEVAASLREAYPLTMFQAKLIDWSHTQFKEVQRSLVSGIHREGLDNNAGPSHPSQAPSESNQSIIRPKNASKLIDFNRAMVAFLYGKKILPEAATEEAPVHAFDEPDNQSAVMDDDRYNKLVAGRAAARHDGPSHSQAHLPSGSSQPSGSRKRTQAELEGNERNEAVDEEDEDEEDEYEQDARRPNDQRRAELDRRAMPPPPKRTRPASQAPPSAQPRAATAGAEDDDVFASPLPRASHQAEPHSTSRSQTSGGVDYSAITQKNRERGIAHRPEASQAAQRRIPWCNSDVEKLIYHIADKHCKWADIWRATNVVVDPGKPVPSYDPDKHFQDYRNQQAIRDKARNLKVDFLKADLVLPQGFDGIILGPKEVAAVTSRGRNPYRKEHDIDGDGNPTHTGALQD